MILARVYVVTCRCGNVPLNQSPTYEAACHVAQAHKDLNPRLCSPTIFADDVPAALAAPTDEHHPERFHPAARVHDDACLCTDCFTAFLALA